MTDDPKRNRSNAKSMFTRSVTSLQQAIEIEAPKRTIEKRFETLRDRHKTVQDAHRYILNHSPTIRRTMTWIVELTKFATFTIH